MKSDLQSVKWSWITADGMIDLAKLPIEGILKQALDPDFENFRSACVLLGSMASHGRQEAGVYLIGLLGRYACDLQRLELIAEEVAYFRDESSANALLAEIRRVRNSNTTRRYLNRVLQSLTRLPFDLVKSGLKEFADDATFSYRMRAKFRESCDRIRI
jgi:hypothetical protein